MQCDNLNNARETGPQRSCGGAGVEIDTEAIAARL